MGGSRLETVGNGQDTVEQVGEVLELILGESRDALGDDGQDGADDLGDLASDAEERLLKLRNQGSAVATGANADNQLGYELLASKKTVS